MTRLRPAHYALLIPLLLLATLWLATWPPSLPSYQATKADWQPSEAWLYDRDGQLLDSIRVNFAQRRLAWLPLADIAPVLRTTLIHAEDRRFPFHEGVDWLATAGAVRDRLMGRPARGTSTLAMQLAAFIAPDLAAPGKRSYWQKLRQMRAAMALSDRWSRDEIIEAYLNLAGYRGEAQGIAAASQTLFAKPASALTKDEALIIVALLPDPQASIAIVSRRACARSGEKSGSAICQRLANLAQASLGPAHMQATDPDLAPHLALHLLPKAGMMVQTKLSLPVQRVARTALRRHLLGLSSQRARDGAVIVLDNASGDVLAYVGGVGGGSTAAQVDGADAYRQAGSTLKPFLYAQAIEQGFLTAASILDDSPVQLDTASGLYVPQNYDRSFKGPVSARTALAGSLNVPAVRTLLLVGVESFRTRLWDSGYAGLTEDGDYYGFSLALGSAEVTLLQQANSYRTLANGGRFTPLHLTDSKEDEASKPRAIFSPQAAWIVADMMADPGARAVTFGLDSALRLPFWAAVKTGTSKAMRDNWCVGFSDRYTVAVWIGNLEGDPMRAVSGTSGAAPVWREVMLALHSHQPGKAPPRPTGLERRAVQFAGALEPVRQEYFLNGTGQSLFALPPIQAERPAITHPANGSVFALDPDIPMKQQRIRVTARGADAHSLLLLDGKTIGNASDTPLILAGPGVHKLMLVNAEGDILHRVRFTIR